MDHVMRGLAIIEGQAEGELLVSHEPLSFWGGYDYRTGEIIDRRHPLSGSTAAGRILGVPFSRGSSTTTAVLLEAVRAGTAPTAIVTTGVDSFFALASIVAQELYGRSIPVVVLEADDFAKLQTGDWVRVRRDGAIVCAHPSQTRESDGAAPTSQFGLRGLGS